MDIKINKSVVYNGYNFGDVINSVSPNKVDINKFNSAYYTGHLWFAVHPDQVFCISAGQKLVLDSSDRYSLEGMPTDFTPSFTGFIYRG